MNSTPGQDVCKITVADMESLRDCADLEDYCSKADVVDSTWTPQQIRRIIAPLQHRQPCDWPTDSRRVELLNRLYFDGDRFSKDDEIKDITDFLKGPLTEYYEKWSVPKTDCLLRQYKEISLDELYPVIQSMSEKGWEDWTDAEISGAAKSLKGCPSLVGRGCSREADSAWWAFIEKWQEFLVENPKIRREVDPFFVIIDVLGVVAHTAIAPSIASFPPSGTPANPPGAPINGSVHFLPFGTQADARQFIGWMQRAVPGLRCWLTNNIAAPVYY